MRRLIKYGLLLLLAIALPLGGYIWYTSWRGQRDLDEIVTQLDAEGPWQWDDLVAARPATPDNQLAPQLIEKVQAAMPAGWTAAKAIENLPDNPVAVLNPAQAEALAEHVALVKDLVAQGRSVVDLPKGRMLLLPAKKEDMFINFARVQDYREFASLMNYDAWHQAHVGDLDAAMKSHLAIWHAARTMDDELTLIPHLVRIALEAITLGSLERTLAQGQPSPETLKRLQDALMEFDPKAAYRVALAGERANTERICRALATGEMSLNQMGPAVGATGGPGDRFAMIYMGISLNESRAAMLRAITKASAAIDLPGSERMSRLEEIDQEFVHAPPIARLFGPAMAKYHHAYARSEAKHQCSIAALAAERFRRETGRWPKGLDELTPKFLPAVPLDRFNDQPLGYRPTRDGVVLYSVGPEGKYGGTYRDGKQDRQGAATYDPSASSYEFRLWNVPQRRQPPQRVAAP